MKYANHVDKSCPRILNWSATSTPRFTELQQIFLDSNLSLCSLLKPTMEECQQDYYKHLNKLDQPTTPKHNTMGDLKDEDYWLKLLHMLLLLLQWKTRTKRIILSHLQLRIYG
ncbi:hypothetical protein AAG906_025934 [Vitis piasezkii]